MALVAVPVPRPSQGSRASLVRDIYAALRKRVNGSIPIKSMRYHFCLLPKISSRCMTPRRKACAPDQHRSSARRQVRTSP